MVLCLSRQLRPTAPMAKCRLQLAQQLLLLALAAPARAADPGSGEAGSGSGDAEASGLPAVAYVVFIGLPALCLLCAGVGVMYNKMYPPEEEEEGGDKPAASAEAAADPSYPILLGHFQSKTVWRPGSIQSSR